MVLLDSCSAVFQKSTIYVCLFNFTQKLRPISPWAADTEVPGERPCIVQTMMFCTFSNSVRWWLFRYQWSEPLITWGCQQAAVIWMKSKDWFLHNGHLTHTIVKAKHASLALATALEAIIEFPLSTCYVFSKFDHASSDKWREVPGLPGNK